MLNLTIFVLVGWWLVGMTKPEREHNRWRKHDYLFWISIWFGLSSIVMAVLSLPLFYLYKLGIWIVALVSIIPLLWLAVLILIGALYFLFLPITVAVEGACWLRTKPDMIEISFQRRDKLVERYMQTVFTGLVMWCLLTQSHLNVVETGITGSLGIVGPFLSVYLWGAREERRQALRDQASRKARCYPHYLHDWPERVRQVGPSNEPTPQTVLTSG